MKFLFVCVFLMSFFFFFFWQILDLPLEDIGTLFERTVLHINNHFGEKRRLFRWNNFGMTLIYSTQVLFFFLVGFFASFVLRSGTWQFGRE